MDIPEQDRKLMAEIENRLQEFLLDNYKMENWPSQLETLKLRIIMLIGVSVGMEYAVKD